MAEGAEQAAAVVDNGNQNADVVVNDGDQIADGVVNNGDQIADGVVNNGDQIAALKQTYDMQIKEMMAAHEKQLASLEICFKKTLNQKPTGGQPADWRSGAFSGQFVAPNQQMGMRTGMAYNAAGAQQIHRPPTQQNTDPFGSL